MNNTKTNINNNVHLNINHSKNLQKLEKNAINNDIFKQISKDFVEWVSGVQEDEPLKSEAKNIYFLLETNQNDFALSYSADEKFFEVLDYGAYFPLDAQYLYSSTLKQLSTSVFQNKTLSKSRVVKMLEKIVFDNKNKFDFFEGHSIFFGMRLSKNQANYCLVK